MNDIRPEVLSMLNEGLIYLATPYSHAEKRVMHERFARACAIAGWLMSHGCLVFSPIAHTHPIAVGSELPRGWDFWKRYDEAMLRASRILVVVRMEGWATSEGIAGEIEIAKELGKQTVFLDPPLDLPIRFSSDFPLGLNQLLETNVQRAVRWHKSPAGMKEWSVLEWAGAMAGEAGEACNAAKKLKRLENDIASINEPGRHYESVEAARAAVGSEVADTIIYGVLLAARAGITDLEDVIRGVFNAKSEQYGFPERL